MTEREDRPLIIVVDEVEGLRWLYAHWLKADGYRVRVAPDKASLADLLVEVRQDLILLDLHLGGLEGIRICRDLKTSLGSDQVKIIGTTTEASGLAGRLAANGEVDGVLVKPFSRIELELAVEAQLDDATQPGAPIPQEEDGDQEPVDTTLGALAPRWEDGPC